MVVTRRREVVEEERAAAGSSAAGSEETVEKEVGRWAMERDGGILNAVSPKT